MITFDELLARAQWIVENSGRSSWSVAWLSELVRLKSGLREAGTSLARACSKRRGQEGGGRRSGSPVATAAWS